MLIIRTILLLIFLFPTIIFANEKLQPPIPISAQQNNQQSPKDSNEQSNKNEIKSKSLKTLPIQNITDPQSQEPQTHGKQDNQLCKAFLDHLFEFLLTLFTGFLAWFTYRLWKATVGLWEVSQEQSRDMKDSLRITQISADATKESADAFQAIERARLFVKVKRDPPAKKGELIEGIKEGYNRVLINIINEGKSIAIITKINWYIEVMNDKEIYNKISELKFNTSEFPYGVITIRGNDSEDIPVMSEITNLDLQKIDYSTTYYVCLGHIKYKDVFRKVREEIYYWKCNGIFFFSDDLPKRNYDTQNEK